MIQSIFSALNIHQGTIALIGQMAFRSIIIYFAGIVLIRVNRRFAGIRTPFNFVLFIMLGSISAAAIVGETPFFPVFSIIVFLILLNRIVAAFVYLFPWFERLLKGPVVLLAKQGEIQWDNMKKNHITKRDLFTELREQLHTDDLSSIDFVVLATDGEIHFIKRNNQPEVSCPQQFSGDIEKKIK